MSKGGYRHSELSDAELTYGSNSGDAVKCAEALQKYIEFWRQRGARKDVSRKCCRTNSEADLICCRSLTHSNCSFQNLLYTLLSLRYLHPNRPRL